MGKIKRIDVTPKAEALVKQLASEYGELMFYQAGGCCEGTQPNCFKKGSFRLRRKDVCIGKVCGFDFWVDHSLFDYWKHAHFTLDVLDGFGTGGFSLEVPKGKTFKIEYRLFTPEELENLEELTIND